MTVVIDKLSELLRDKSSAILSKCYIDLEVSKIYEDMLEKFWIQRDFPMNYSENYTAIDGSVLSVPLIGGSAFFAVVAHAFYSKNQNMFKYDIDIASGKDVDEFLNYYMEMLEAEVALDSLRYSDIVVFDGSFYGRLCHVLEEKDVYGYEDLMLRHLKVYAHLMNIFKKEKITPIAISKTSSSTVLRDLLLFEYFTKKKEKFMEIYGEEIKNIESYLIKVLMGERGRIGISYEDAFIFELKRKTSDFSIVKFFAKGTGYTKPLLLGMPKKKREELKLMRKDPESFISARFPSLDIDKGTIMRAYSLIKNLPSIVTFYVYLGSQPIRVDIPAFAVGINKKLAEAKRVSSINVDVSEIADFVASCYVNDIIHNYKLYLADKRVKITKKQMKKVLIPLFSSIADFDLIDRSFKRWLS